MPSLQRNFHIARALKALELLSPLYQENAVVSDEVIEPQRFQLARRINPVQVDVVEVSLGTAIFVDQGEGGAGDVVRDGGLEGFRNAFDQRSLARSQIAAQQHQFRRSQHSGQSTAKRDGLLSGMSDEFLRGHESRNRMTSIAIPIP